MADINSFISTYMPAAQLAAGQLGTDPAHVLGQWGLETGWGKSVIPGTNNLGNIKSTDGQGVSAVDNQLGTSDKYAAYSSPEQAAQGYSDLLHHSRYSGVVGSGGDTGSFVQGLVNGGYAQDPQYGAKLNSAIGMVKQAGATPSLDDMKAQLAQQVTEDYANGVPASQIVSGLLNTKLAGADVQAALQKGVKADQILSVVGGHPFAQFRASDPGEQVKQQGFLTNVGQGAANAVSDLGNGAQQIGARLSGNDAGLQQLQTQQAQTEADPSRVALGHTVGGTLGSGGVKALPYIAAGALAPEGLLPAVLAQGATGVASGAMTPTTGDGQIGKNMLTDGALGAVGGGAGHVLGGAVSGVLKGLGGDAAATAKLAEAQAQGLPANAATLSGPGGFWRNVMESMPENKSVQGFQDQADKAVAGKVAEGLGLNGYEGPIDTNMLSAARPGIKAALDNATNVQVVLPQALKTDLGSIMQAGANPLTEGIASNSIVKQAITNLNKAVDSGAPVAGQDLQGLASELKGMLYSQTATHSEKQLASNVVDQINDALKSNMTPEQQAAYGAANDQYRNLLAVQKMVKGSNDTGVVTPRQMLQAAKTGSFSNSFLQGAAPFQDLAGTASDLYGPAAGKGLGAVIGKAIGGHGLDATALLVHPSPLTLAGVAAKALAGNALGKLATSTNPTVVRLLSGAGGQAMDPAMAQFIAKAIGTSGAAGAGSLGS